MAQTVLFEQLSSELSNIIERTSPSIVLVQGRRIPSSGFVWQKNLIITADHSLPKTENVLIKTSEGELITSNLAGRDPSMDIAILKTTAELPPIENIPNTPLKTGQFAVCIGRANGGRLLAVSCMISGTDSSYRNWRGGTLDQFIRLDTASYPGFSGSALLLPNGKVAGMNTSAFSRHFGLTVPASNIQRLVERLSTKGSIGKPHLGLMMQPIRLSQNLRDATSGEVGLLIMGTESGSPAETAGLFTGDIVVRVNEKNVDSIQEIYGLLTDESIGKEVKLGIIRGGKPQEVNVKVGERPLRQSE